MDLVHLAQTLQATRRAQKLTLDELARRSGLSKGFLSRLENFRVTPSLNALNRVATALGLEMADVFRADGAAPEVVFGSLDTGEELVRDQSDKYGIRYLSLAFRKHDRVLDPFVVEYRPTRRQRRFLMHDADEFFLLLDGAVEFMVGSDANPRRMRKGDTVYLARNVPHSVRLAPKTTAARALVVYCQRPPSPA